MQGKRPDPVPPTVYCLTQLVARGDGTFSLVPGKPLSKLTPKQFGKAVGLNEDTICKYLGKPALPDSLVERSGSRIFILAAAVTHWRNFWKRKRGGKRRLPSV